MSEIIKWSAGETAENIRNRNVSVAEVTQAHLAQIERVNPKINAITEVAADAMDIAREMDAKNTGDDLPPLFGVPVTTKINADQTGYANSNGIPAYKDNVCTEDSAVVHNMKAAGSVVIGRTNTPEFSMRWCTSNPLYGVSLNPWNKDVTPGGSSGAAAAAVASGIGTIAHGNDLGGSLRYPAMCCGVATIRPSLGRVATHNPSAKAERPPITHMMSVQGPIARSMADVRLGLQAMSQRSSNDPLWTNAQSSGRARGDKLKIGFCVNPYGGKIDQATETAMHDAIAACREAGFEVVETPMPEANLSARLWGDLLFTETEAAQGEAIRAFASDDMKALFDVYKTEYDLLDVNGFIQKCGDRTRVQRLWAQMFDDIDLYMMPTSMIAPFENDLDFKDKTQIPALLEAQKPLHSINVLGLPSAAFPTGLANGAPIGVQLVGAMHDDWFVLDCAERIEAVLGTIWQDLEIR